MPVDNHIKQMIQDLGHALVQAIAASPEAADAIGKIRQEGYSLYLSLDRDESGGREARIELTHRQSGPKEAAFVLDKGDVSLLKSLGIDATRSGKRR
ncbi:MAG: hypothetical protein AAF657_06865 [Acidobacteriota bacterium]